MIIDTGLFDMLSAQAASSPRLRMNYDLRTTPADGSQRMLNALEPGTCVPIHRHRTTSEVVVMLRGRAVQYFYDDAGEVTQAVLMVPAGSLADDVPSDAGSCICGGRAPSAVCSAVTVEPGRWHRIDSLESGTVIFECKDGAFVPLSQDDILEKNE